jgi:hypothetical protein
MTRSSGYVALALLKWTGCIKYYSVFEALVSIKLFWRSNCSISFDALLYYILEKLLTQPWLIKHNLLSGYNNSIYEDQRHRPAHLCICGAGLGGSWAAVTVFGCGPFSQVQACLLRWQHCNTISTSKRSFYGIFLYPVHSWIYSCLTCKPLVLP